MPRRSEQTQHELDNFRENAKRKLGGGRLADAVNAYAHDLDKRDRKQQQDKK